MLFYFYKKYLSVKIFINIILLFFLIILNISESLLLARGQSSFLQMGIGAKSLALGGAYEATVDNPTAVYWNPAGLARIYEINDMEEKEIKKNNEKANGNKMKHDTTKKGKEFYFQINASGTMFAQNSYSGFTGLGMNLFSGVLGLAILTASPKTVYSILRTEPIFPENTFPVAMPIPAVIGFFKYFGLNSLNVSRHSNILIAH